MKILSYFFCLFFILSVAEGSEEQWIRVNSGTWDPGPEIMADLKNRIEPNIRNIANSQGRKLKDWQDYIFQHQGREENSWKIIFINALCKTTYEPNLNEEIVQIFDGGNCYFNVKFDPIKKVFFNLIVNGES